MIEVYGDIWGYQADFIGITTNGTVNRKGACVMGRGVALQAVQHSPRIALNLGKAILQNGNHVHLLRPYFSFPVKHEWWQKADIELIRRSAHELEELARLLVPLTFVLPRPGCGNGGLRWIDVKPLVQSILPDNVAVITLEVA